MSLPLSKIRVLDFTHLLPGELCSTILGDLGAHITRVESLKPGLAQRLPPLVKGESLYYWSLHRNKERIALDLKNEKGIEIIHKLISQTDVILENFRPGVMSRLGVGYGKLRAYNKGLVYCSISGYGQNSSFSHRPGHDLNFQAESGVLNMIDLPDGKPLVTGLLVSDYMSATYAALSVVSALYEKERTGKGRHLDISMFHCALSTLNIAATGLLYTGQCMPEDSPAYRDALVSYNVYRCKDGRYLAVASLERPFWDIFCQRIERPDLLGRYPVGPHPELKEILADVIAKKTLLQWSEIFADSNCCVSPVNNLSEALDFLPTKERNMITHLSHPLLGKVPQLLSPIPFHAEVNSPAQAPADPAEGTAALLKHLGYSDVDIRQLSEEGIIPTPPG